MMINVNAVGRLTKDAKLTYTTSGKPVATFTLACNRSYTDRNGNRATTFVRCVLWGKIAESFFNYTRKGTLISLSGELTSRQYENQQGETQYMTEINVDTFDYLESKATVQSREQSKQNHQENAANQETRMPQEPNNHVEQPPIDGLNPYGANTN